MYGSLDDYEPTDNELICKSGYMASQKDIGDTVCMPTPTIKNKTGPDYKCDSPIDTCLYESVFANGEVHEFSLSCKCGLTPTGSAFCPKVYKQDYTNLMQETL